MFKFNFKFGKEKDSTTDENQKKAKKEKKAKPEMPKLTPEEKAHMQKVFHESIQEVVDIQQKIRWKTAALDAMFVRRFKKFKTEQEYLDLLKIMKFHDVYEDAGVDLESGNAKSIDKFCKKMLTKEEYERDYLPVSLIEVKIADDANESGSDTVEDIALDEEAKVKFNIKEEDDGQEIQFHSEDQIKGSTDKGRKDSKENVSEDEKQQGSISSGNNEADSDSSGSSTSSTKADERRKLEKEVNDLANMIKDRFFEKGSGTEITVSRSLYDDGTYTGAFDVSIKEANGTQRFYHVDKGSVIPGRSSVVAWSANGQYAIGVPLVKKERDLVKKIFGGLYMLTDEEFKRICETYYMNLELCNYIDFSNTNYINSLSKQNKQEFVNNLKFTIDSVTKSSNRNFRFRISKFNNVDDFELSSDSLCVSPVPGILANREIGFIKATFKRDHDIIIDKSDDRREKERAAKKEMEVKDHRRDKVAS